MADAKISGLAAAASVATTTVVPVVRSGGNVTEKATLAQIAPVIGESAAGFTASGTGAVARSMRDKMREWISVTDFGAAGDGVTDDTTAFANALGTGKSIRVPPGNYKITSGLTMTTSGQRMEGAGPWLSIIEWAGGSVDAITMVDDQYMALRGLMIRPKSGLSALTGGYAVAITRSSANTLCCDVSDVLIYGMYNGILMRSLTEGLVHHVMCWALTGAYGIRFDGTAAAASYAGTLDTVRFGGMESNTSIVLVDQNSYGYSLRMHKCVLLAGGTGFRMADDTNDGASYPMWCIGVGNECDHNDDAGVDLAAGEGFNWGESWIGSCLSGPGLRTKSAWRGEMTLSGTRVMGNKHHGITLEAGVDSIITGCAIGDNSAGSSAAYHGVNVAAGITRFTITNSRIGDLVGAAGNAQGYGIKVATGASDYYQIVGNLLSGNTTGAVSDGGTGINKLVQTGGGGFDRVQIGDVNSYLMLVSGTDPTFIYDGNDYRGFTRSTNTETLVIGGTAVETTSASAKTINLPVLATSFAVDSTAKLRVGSGIVTLDYDTNDNRSFTRSSNTETLTINSVAVETATDTKKAVNVPFQLAGFAVASLPSAVTYAGCTIRITDRNNRLASADGTNWVWAGQATATAVS